MALPILSAEPFCRDALTDTAAVSADDNLAPRSAGANGHLDPGEGPTTDPAYYHSPLTTAEPAKPRNSSRLSWQSSAMSFYDQPLTLEYEGLDEEAAYEVDIVFSTKKPEHAKPGSTAASFQEQVRSGIEGLRLL